MEKRYTINYSGIFMKILQLHTKYSNIKLIIKQF